MPNDYFQFKQFTVRQDRSAMKVTTDSCLFGAWVATIYSEVHSANSSLQVLDIGTGTGLLSLLLAQKINAGIEAIEVDAAAASQAVENFAASPWHDRLRVLVGDARNHAFERKYDLVISNPPFYENDLRSPDASVNDARHDTALTLEELGNLVSRVIKADGYFGVLLPFHRHQYFEGEALRQELVPVRYMFIKPTIKHQYNRVFQLYEKAGGQAVRKPVISEELIIKEIHHSYSNEFISYLQEYYLSL